MLLSLPFLLIGINVIIVGLKLSCRAGRMILATEKQFLSAFLQDSPQHFCRQDSQDQNVALS